MLPSHQGAIRLFRVAGIDVFLHWSWFLAAAFFVNGETATELKWNALAYLSLFAIVLLHEFGHALACRQVGGEARQIILWPLGGIAFVAPPPRPGPVLWSLAAGPLVNLLLAPFLYLLYRYGVREDWIYTMPYAFKLVADVQFINLVLFVFNLLPIYPLDGGQMLRAVLWFWVGPVRSLLIATSIGFVGVAALVFLAIWLQQIWTGILAAFVFMQCQRAWMMARLAGMQERRNVDIT